MAADEAQDEAKLDASVEATIEPFLDMRDMASVCVRDLCMFWNDHSKSCYIVDTLKTNLYHTICPKCGSTNIQLSTREGRTGKTKSFRCDTCNNEWSSVH